MAETIQYTKINETEIKKTVTTTDVKEELYNKTELLRWKLQVLDSIKSLENQKAQSIKSFDEKVIEENAKIKKADELLLQLK